MNFKDYLPFLIEGVHGTYAGVRFHESTIRDLMIMQDLMHLPNRLDPEKFHSTLLFSRKPLPNYIPFGEYPECPTSDTNVFELKVFKTSTGKNALVLAYDCEFLSKRHKELMKEHGGTWDHPSFIPHITLSYDIGDTKIELGETMFISDRKIVILSEYGSDLDLSWS